MFKPNRISPTGHSQVKCSERRKEFTSLNVGTSLDPELKLAPTIIPLARQLEAGMGTKKIRRQAHAL